jgi:hypothetical protein
MELERALVRKIPDHKSRPNDGRNVRLRPANSFDLIRLIALSQSDPRKAVAELVQNSFDAGASQIVICRQRRRGEIGISIHDDGRGVFPELERPAALKHIATNIGHSFKRNLSVAERQAQMQLGKYGIGILGFWCVGAELEMRSRVAGSEVWCLRLRRDEPIGEVRRVPQSRIAFDGETWTEVLIRGVQPGAMRQLSGRRLGDYLGSELRGQLLARPVKLRILDRIARGLAPKDFLVVPRRFQGGRIGGLEELAVEGFSPSRLELYAVDSQDERRGAVSLTCGGTVVCDDLGEVDGYDLEPAIWGAGGLEGIVEFGDLEVAPSTRRGFVPTPAAEALFRALKGIEPSLAEALDRERQRRDAEADEDTAHQLRRIFRPMARSLPQYDFFEISGDDGLAAARRRAEGERLGRADGPENGGDGGDLPPGEPQPEADGSGAEVSEVLELGDTAEPPAELLPPGPMEELRLAPRRCRLLPGARRGFAARAVDSAGRSVEGEVAYEWSVVAGEGALEGDGARATFTASGRPGAARIRCRAAQGERACEAEAEIEVVESLAGDNPDAGIPDPRRVFDSNGDWRSRVRGRVWEYNAAHPDYQAVVEDSKQRLRYLAHLFAKEIVLRNYGEARDERILERMVEVLTHIRRG